MKNSTFLFRVILPLMFIALGITGKAQLVGWKYKDAIKIQENSGSLKLNYQVLLTINTQALISTNKMNATGSDIRFAKDCNGATLYSYWIESGINTANTQIWVLIDSLPASGSRIINMFYGNSAATATASFDSTFTPISRLIVSAGSVVQTGVNNYSWFEIQSTGTVVITPNAPFVVNARKIKVTGTLNGNGGGYLGGQTGQNGGGPGAGKAGSAVTPGNTSGGGGAYGGDGGRGNKSLTTNGDGGIAYGNITTIDMGSGGGGPVGVGAGTTEGNGGAAVTFNAREVEITGTVSLNGNAGTSGNNVGWSGGGGAGGGFLLKAYKTLLSGQITAKGGSGGGGNAGGGGGGGGRINLFSENPFTPGTYDVSFGLKGITTNTANPAAVDGSPGVISTGTFVANEPTVTFLPTAYASADVMVCLGYTTQLNVTGGTAYTWTPATGLSCTTCANPIASPTITTNYAVAIADNNCTTNDTVVVTVDACLGITGQDNPSEISVTPNPSNGAVTLNIADISAKSVAVEVYSLQGKLISMQNYEVHNGMLNEQLNLSGLAPGIYSLKVSSSTNYYTNKKIVIQ